MNTFKQEILDIFPEAREHSDDFLRQWARYLPEKPIDEDFIWQFDKFYPLYRVIMKSPSLKSSTKPLSWFLDRYETIIQANSEEEILKIVP